MGDLKPLTPAYTRLGSLTETLFISQAFANKMSNAHKAAKDRLARALRAKQQRTVEENTGAPSVAR
jgi:hypothetical protein